MSAALKSLGLVALRLGLTAVVFALLLTFPVTALCQLFAFIGIYGTVSAFLAGLRLLFSKREIYSLAHTALNVDAEQETWNNMGYWVDGDFKHAARELCRRVGAAAGLADQDVLLDVGIGCGDQSVVYAGQTRKYIGITNVEAQARMARARLAGFEHAQVITADASGDDMWRTNVAGVNKIIALDCLYHFQPSRLPFFMFSHDVLAKAGNAAFAAEDLLLGDDARWFDRLLLRSICALTHTPYANFVTQNDYAKMLFTAGFGDWDIQMEDISDHVFPGLVEYINKRKAARFLRLDEFVGFARVVKWWHTRRVVRAFIITITR